METIAFQSVQHAFVLSNKMKRITNNINNEIDIDYHLFRATMEECKNEIRTEPDWDVAVRKSDKDGIRWDLYNKCRWRLDCVELRGIRIYPKMGRSHKDNEEIPELKGTVDDAAKIVSNHLVFFPKIKNMKQYADMFCRFLPIIIVNTKRRKYDIDDGNHRAVAMYLAGIRKVNAWVGEEDSTQDTQYP